MMEEPFFEDVRRFCYVLLDMELYKNKADLISTCWLQIRYGVCLGLEFIHSKVNLAKKIDIAA